MNRMLWALLLLLMIGPTIAIGQEKPAEDPALTRAQKNEIERANQLNQTCISEYLAGNYAESVEAAKSALRIRRKVLGEEHPDYAETLNNLAGLYETIGDYAQAEPLFIQCKDIQRKVLGEEHPDYANTLNNLAFLYESMGDYARAEPLYIECRDIQKRTLGEEHPDYATTLNNLAGLYESTADYARAEPLYIQCKDIQKRLLGGEHPDYATTLNNLGLLYGAMGDFARAEPLYIQCKDIQKRTLGEQHPFYTTTLNNLASLYQSMGDYSRAELLFVQCKEIEREVLGEEHPDYATTLNNLGLLYGAMDDFERAEPLYIQCKEVRQKVLGEEHPDYVTTLSNLAALYWSVGDYERAEPLYIQCKEVRQKVLGEEHPDYATTLLSLALLYKSMGDYERAEPLYIQSKEFYQKALGEEHPNYAIALNNLAALYYSMGNYARAESLAANSLKITLNHLRETSLILSERQQLAMNQMLRYQLDSYLSLSIEEGNGFRSKAARQVLTWKGATLVRQRGIRLAATDPEIGEQFKQLQSLSRQLASLSRIAPDEKADDWKHRIRELTDKKERLEVELSQKSANFRDALKTITPELIQTSIPADGVLVDFLQYTHSKPSKENEGELEFSPSILAVVARREGEPLLIELGSKATLAEAIDQWRETFGMSPVGKRAGTAIRKQIWEPLLEHIGDAKTVLVSTDGVLGRLPIAALPGKEPGTYLIEDHRIALVPVPQLLPALVNAEGTKELTGELLLLGDVDYDVNEKQTPKKKRKKRRPGNRAYGVDHAFERLEGAAGEVAAIQVLYEDLFEADDDDVRALKRASASEAAFRANAANYRFLHIATHGFFASAKVKSALGSEAMLRSNRARLASNDSDVRGMNPDLLSGLALAGANLEPAPGKDDGILTAQEIAFLPLEGVETAVLSACETGLGEVAGGEGLIGIQRAFQIAGVRTTVASLWKVDDQATRVLMERFYRNLWEKEMGHLDALREAQLYILNNPESVRSLGVEDNNQTSKRTSPKLWAAFQVSGYWE